MHTQLLLIVNFFSFTVKLSIVRFLNSHLNHTDYAFNFQLTLKIPLISVDTKQRVQ